MKKKKKINVVLADFKADRSWEFIEGLEKKTGMQWDVLAWDKKGFREGKFDDVKRYAGYFWRAFGIFAGRGVQINCCLPAILWNNLRLLL